MSKENVALNISNVRRLCENWPWLSRAEFSALLMSDCAYKDVPIPNREAVGPDAAFEKLSGLKKDWDISFRIVSIVGDEHTVFAERVEYFHNRVGAVDDWQLPCVGVFELEGGKIKSWRDYWNFADAEPLMRYSAAKPT
jgi:limonene-1,2-epoxide hydrolase